MASKKEKKFDKSLYLKTFIISTAIFSFGLIVGIYIENFFVSDLATRAREIENSVREIELEMLYFQELSSSGEPSKDSCNFLNAIVRKTNKNLDALAGELTQYSEKNVLFTTQEIRNIKKTYTSLLIKDWLLQERVKKNCGTKIVTVLYFYSTEGCDDCITQGNVLTLLKSIFKEKLMVFPIDIQIDLSMTEILMNRFNITTTPTIVINEKPYKGIIGKAELMNMICEELPEVDVCKS